MNVRIESDWNREQFKKHNEWKIWENIIYMLDAEWCNVLIINVAVKFKK